MNEYQPDSTMESLFEDMLMNEEIRQRLALGRYYDILQFNSEEESQLKEQFLKAKKYERESLEVIKKDIEHEEMTKLTSKQIKQAKVLSKEYRKRATNIGKQAEGAVNLMQKRAALAETRELQKIKQKIKEKHQQKIMEARQLFEEREKQYALLESQEFQERENWRYKMRGSKQKHHIPSQQMITPVQEDHNKVELIMTVDIGDGRVDTIKVHKNDDYEVLAKMFQAKHNLVEDVVVPLTAHIQNNIDALRSKKENSLKSSSRKSAVSTKTPKRRLQAEKVPYY